MSWREILPDSANHSSPDLKSRRHIFRPGFPRARTTLRRASASSSWGANKKRQILPGTCVALASPLVRHFNDVSEKRLHAGSNLPVSRYRRCQEHAPTRHVSVEFNTVRDAERFGQGRAGVG